MNEIEYAGFWRRLAAFIIDQMILNVFETMAVFLVSLPLNTLSFLLLANVLYFTGFESSGKQATPGKQAFGIAVTDLEGRRISLPCATLRFVSKFLSAILFGAGFLTIAISKNKQGLHDRIAGTLVVMIAKKKANY